MQRSTRSLVLGLLLIASYACLAAPTNIQVCVKDPAGLPVTGASVTTGAPESAGLHPVPAGRSIAVDQTGCRLIPADTAASLSISAAASGFGSTSVLWSGEQAV